MKESDFQQRLLQRLKGTRRAGVGLGIDLGTTKSCVAYAAYDPKLRELRCECVAYP